jgi:hypothetical protein
MVQPIPTRLREIFVGPVTNSYRETIRARDGKVVFLKDSTLGEKYILGQIRVDNMDGEHYFFQRRDDAGKEVKLKYRNLTGLLVIES